jgi:predicted flap endonuclease-1-like 5' DNA nuclease
MGAFVLGVLVGWLLEWLFFTFWIKGRSTGKFADCSSFEKELNNKNKQISALKEDLDKAQSNSTTSQSSKKEALSKSESEKKIATKAASSTAATKTGISNKKVNSQSTKKTTTKSAVAKKSPAKKSTSKKAATSKSATAKKAVAAKSTSTKKATTSKPATVKKATPKTTAAKKGSTAKKSASSGSTTANKVATSKKAAVPKQTAVKIPKSGDDLTRLSGIGPSMASKLHELGITTFKKLADMDDDILRDMLEASGARLNNNKEAMDTWNEQASLADKGDLAGLKKLQDMLKK